MSAKTSKPQTMWGLFNFDRLMGVGHRRGVLMREIGDKKGWAYLRKKGAVRCVRVEVREIKRARP